MVRSVPRHQLLRQDVPGGAQSHAQGGVRGARPFDDAHDSRSVVEPPRVPALVQRRRVEADRERVHVPGPTHHGEADVPVDAMEHFARRRPAGGGRRRRATRHRASAQRFLRLLRLHLARSRVVGAPHARLLRGHGPTRDVRHGRPRSPGVYAAAEDAVGEALRRGLAGWIARGKGDDGDHARQGRVSGVQRVPGHARQGHGRDHTHGHRQRHLREGDGRGARIFGR